MYLAVSILRLEDGLDYSKYLSEEEEYQNEKANPAATTNLNVRNNSQEFIPRNESFMQMSAGISPPTSVTDRSNDVVHAHTVNFTLLSFPQTSQNTCKSTQGKFTAVRDGLPILGFLLFPKIGPALTNRLTFFQFLSNPVVLDSSGQGTPRKNVRKNYLETYLMKFA